MRESMYKDLVTLAGEVTSIQSERRSQRGNTYRVVGMRCADFPRLALPVTFYGDDSVGWHPLLKDVEVGCWLRVTGRLLVKTGRSRSYGAVGIVGLTIEIVSVDDDDDDDDEGDEHGQSGQGAVGSDASDG